MLAFDRYYWRPELNRYRYACRTDGSVIYDHLETHGYEGFGSGFLRAALLLGNSTLLSHILAVKSLAERLWAEEDRYDEWRTYSVNNTVAGWTHLRTAFSSQLWWYDFWLRKNMSDVDTLLAMYEWWAENRRTPYGYEAGHPPHPYVWPCCLYFMWTYHDWFYQLSLRLRGPAGVPGVGDVAILSSDPLGFWYCDVLSLRLWVR